MGIDSSSIVDYLRNYEIIGLDFDNTLIDDYLFYKTALDSELIPINITKSKVGVRNYLLNEGKEELFTILHEKLRSKDQIRKYF